MTLIPFLCFIFGGAIVYLYFSYKKETPSELKPSLLYIPMPVDEELLDAQRNLYEQTINKANQIIRDLAQSETEEDYQKALGEAYDWLAVYAEWEKKEND